jgi:hypothetical protein
MPAFSGRFQYLNPDGTIAQSSPCHLTFAAETLTLTPAGGPPITFDFGDIEVFAPADYELTLTLYTGKKIVLNQLGKTFQGLSQDLLEAYRKRLIECLLLEDLEEVARFEGVARLESPARTFSSPAEFRLYQSNLAVLPTATTAFQWRLADIDAIDFDEANYAVALSSAGARLTATKLAKRTREFQERLQAARTELAEKAAEILHDIFPFLTPDEFQQVAHLLKEGHAVPLAQLKVIHPKCEKALVEDVIDPKLKPYFDTLLGHIPAGWLYSGFKLLREEEAEEATTETAPESGEGAETEAPLQVESANTSAVADAGSEGAKAKQPILHWFFFPLAAKPGAKLPANLVAWEATSKFGRATYFFRLVPPEQAPLLADPANTPAVVDAAIRELNRALVLLNFRREPIYLPDESLEIQPRFRRYAIACRKLPALRRLRASFLGRAIHTSLENWRGQLEGFVVKSLL